MSGRINSPWLKRANARPLTEDTEFLICIYFHRGDSTHRIAIDLNRSERQVERVLKKAMCSGRYDKHVNKHLEHLANDIPLNRNKTEYL